MKTLLILLGPTGVGKTALSLDLAQIIQSPILNVDSRQLYKDIPIGTAAPTDEELNIVQHYFVGTLELQDYYSAALYEKEALNLLCNLFEDRDIVLMSGGAMMYIDAVCQGIDDIPTVDNETRQILQCKLNTEGLERLVAELKMLDYAYYKEVDLKNTARIIHALEICYMTGKSFSSFRKMKKKERPFNIVKIGLNRDRAELFERINYRVDQMIERGLMEEVEKVYPYKHTNSLKTVGYNELFKVLENEWDLDFALNRMKKNTRVYAKKQLTWFKKDRDVHWFSPDNRQEIVRFIQENNLLNS